MLYVHRVLHPVGEGAFFTEQFYDEKKSCVFSVVYDCGSIHDQEKALIPQINNAFFGKEIDMMFISHFDDDHVNGIEKLIIAKKLTNKSKAFIPFIIPLEDLYKLDAKSKKQLENYKTIFNILKRNHVRIIPVVPDRVPFNDYPYKDDENVGIFQISGCTIKLDHLYWNYIPFYVSEDYYNAFVKGIRDYNDDKENQSHKIEIEKLYDPEEVQKHIDKLKPIYQKLGKSARGVTKINVNSLLVLSKAEDPRMVKYVMFIGGKLPVLPFGFTFHFDSFYHRICNESCLYTGDCTLKSKKYWAKLIQQLQKCNISEIGLFQIPHHGSPNNYNNAIPNNNDFTLDAGFVNCCLTKGNAHFEYKTIEDFWRNCKPLFLVTEDPVSKIHFVITLEVPDNNQQTPKTTEIEHIQNTSKSI